MTIPLAHRIVLTERCNQKCPHCFNADQRDAADMDIEKLFSFWALNRPYLKRAELKIMGGEPTIHPEFTRLCDVAIAMFDKINCFTNGTKLDFIKHPDIMAATWTGKMSYTFNGFTFRPLGPQWQTHGKYFKGIKVHFVVPEKADKSIEKFLSNVKTAVDNLDPEQCSFIFSGNTGVNLFDENRLERYRKTYVNALGQAARRVRMAGFEYQYDHCFPRCFWTQSMLDEYHDRDLIIQHLERTHCCDTILGLIDTDFNLWYCNQTRIKLGNLFRKGKPRPMQQVLRMIRSAPGKKLQALCDANTMCNKCPSASTCKAACWYEQAIRPNFSNSIKEK